MNKKNILAITGPTNSGKTKLAIKLANNKNAEIINIDSVLIYKRMNIGSAKPFKKHTHKTKHHLINNIEPWYKYSIYNFFLDIQDCIININKKNILLVGGNMMYYKQIINGITFCKKSYKLRNILLKKSIKSLYYFLKKKDLIYSKKIYKNDKVRIVKTLEIIIVSGLSYLKIIKWNKKKLYNLNIKIYSVISNDRNYLYKRINLRLKKMICKGLFTEIKFLLKISKINIDFPSINSIGYKQGFRYFLNEINYDTFKKKTLNATKYLAKKQLTWIRNWGDSMFIIKNNKYYRNKFIKIL